MTRRLLQPRKCVLREYLSLITAAYIRERLFSDAVIASDHRVALHALADQGRNLRSHFAEEVSQARSEGRVLAWYALASGLVFGLIGGGVWL